MPNFHRKYTEAGLKLQLKRLAFDLGRTPTQTDVDLAAGCADSSTFATVFGSWNAALEKAGLTPVRISRYSKEVLLRKLRRFILLNGRKPTVQEIDEDKSMPSSSSYRKHFGSLSKALDLVGIEL